MLKVLVVGNSYGMDATRYVWGISRAAGSEVRTVNLYIGGCSLQRHYRNMLSGEPAYKLHYCGLDTELTLSLQQGMLMDEWDVIVFQQASYLSGRYATYQPYLTELTVYARKCCPAARIVFHETWTFDRGCPRFKKSGFEGPEDMLPAMKDAFAKAAESIHADFTIPSVSAVYALWQEIGAETYRDGFHCSKGITRYMLGCLWFMALTGKSIEGNSFRDFDEPVSEEQVARAQRIALKAAREAGLLK